MLVRDGLSTQGKNLSVVPIARSAPNWRLWKEGREEGRARGGGELRLKELLA